MKIEYLLSIALALYVFFLTSTISTAGYSVGMALLILLEIAFFLKNYNNNANIYFSQEIVVPIILYVIFFALMLISSYQVGDKKSLEEVIKYLQYSSPFLILYIAYMQTKNISMIMLGLYASLLVISLVSIYQFFTLPLGSRIPGVFAHFNHLSLILETLLPFALFVPINASDIKANVDQVKYLQMARWIIIIMTVFSLTVTQSRGGISGVLFGALAVILAKYILLNSHIHMARRIFIYGLALVMVCGSVICLTKAIVPRKYDGERVLLIQSSYNMWKDHPTYGVGLANWSSQYKKKYISDKAKEPDLATPHNVPMYFLSTTGWVGTLGYVVLTFGLIGYLYKKLLEQPNNMYILAMIGAIIGLTSHGMVDIGITNKFAAREFWGFLGLTLATIVLYSRNLKEHKDSV